LVHESGHTGCGQYRADYRYRGFAGQADNSAARTKLLNGLTGFNEHVNILNKILIPKSMEYIIERTEVIHHAVFFEQAYGILSVHVVFVFVSFNAKRFEINDFRHKADLLLRAVRK
jgi:hypothetical protein